MGATAAIATGAAALIGAGSAAYSAHKSKERAEDQEREIKRRTKKEQERLAEEKEALKGRQRAAYAAAGMDIRKGTPLAVIEETERIYREEHKEVGKRGRYASNIAKREGRDLWTTGMFDTAGTLLGGAARTYQAGRGHLW